jgi:hypothetical protein
MITVYYQVPGNKPAERYQSKQFDTSRADDAVAAVQQIMASDTLVLSDVSYGSAEGERAYLEALDRASRVA